jgi:GTP-binding protein
VLTALATDQSDLRITLFSSLKRQGVGEVAEILHGWMVPTDAPVPVPDPAPTTDTPDHDPIA